MKGLSEFTVSEGEKPSAVMAEMAEMVAAVAAMVSSLVPGLHL